MKQTSVIDISSFTTDAKFRTWGSACSTALQASRLVKTSDTGQINWVTVTKPVVTNTQAGYEIYRFADTLQGTAPVYMRIGFGSGTTTGGNAPCTWLTVGTGTDGAGNITGINTGALQGYNASVTVSNTAMTAMFTHTNDGYCFLNFGTQLASGATTNAGLWVIDRSRNSVTGASTVQGVGVWRIMYSTSFSSVYGLDFSTSTAYTTARNPLAGMPATSFSLATGASVPLAKNFINLGASVPSMGVLSYYTSDITASSTFTSTPWGSTPRTYYALGTQAQFMDGSSSANILGAVLWED